MTGRKIKLVASAAGAFTRLGEPHAAADRYADYTRGNMSGPSNDDPLVVVGAGVYHEGGRAFHIEFALERGGVPRCRSRIMALALDTLSQPFGCACDRPFFVRF